MLTSSCTLKNIRAVLNKDMLPTTDMNAKFGNLLTRKNAIGADAEINQQFTLWLQDPLAASYQIGRTLRKYRDKFR